MGEVFDKVQDALRHVRRAMDAVEAAAGKHPWSPPSLVGVWPDLNEITHRLQDAANEAAEKQEESGVAA